MNDYLKYRLQIKNEGKPPTQKKVKKIAPFSKKRLAANKVYAEKSRPFWEEKACQIRSPVCTGAAQGIHHRKGKATIVDLLDERYWMAACNFCNTYVETHDEWARKMGYKVSRM